MPEDAFSAALVDALLGQATDFVGVYDAALGRFTRVNPAGARLLGYASPAALLAAPNPLAAAPGLDWPGLCALAQRLGHAGAPATVPAATGELLDLNLLLTYVAAPPAAPCWLVRLSQPGRLRQAERELVESEQRFTAVVVNATIGIVMCDRAGTIVLANQLAHRQFGYAEETLLGQSIDQLVPMPAGRHERLRESFNNDPQVRSMGAHRGDLNARRQDGSVFPVEVSLSYFYLNAELYVVSYVLDITAKKNAAHALVAERQRVERLNAELEQKVADRTQALLTTLEQLEQRQAELAQALAAEQELGELKSRFVSMASHEFRTPLTAVLTSASLIEKYPAAEQQDKRLRHLERIRTSVTHLNDILEEFLSVGRIEEGRVMARPAHLDLPALLRDTVADVQGLYKAGQTIATEADCPALLWLDPSLLRKVLVNLLSNALKYSGENSVVTLRGHCQDHCLTLVVRDEGIGISPEDQLHLFGRFYRAHGAANVPGTGLGLYIVARYLELLGGTIALASKLGRGTTVTVTVPYEDAPAD